MWPFGRKDAASPAERKSASFLLGTGAGSYLAANADYRLLASEGYMLNCVAFSCINRIATAVSSVEPKMYRVGKGGKLTQIDEHPALTLLESPNPAQSGKEFMQHLVSQRLTGGNAFVYGNGIEPRGSKPPREMQLLDPGKVTVKPGDGLFPLYYQYSPGGKGIATYPVDQITGLSAVLHLKTFNPLNPWVGLSPLLAAAYSLDIHNGGQKWNKRLLDNDARPSGALTVRDGDGKPASLTEEQYQRLKQMIDNGFSGANNAHRPLLLEGGLEWQELSLSPTDLDWMEGKHSAARDIALAFGVPPQLIGIPGDSTFANYEQATLSFWNDTVIPLLCVILEGFNRWLTPLYGEGTYLWYDEEMIPALEPRRKQKGDRLNAAGYLTINEKRRAMGLEDVEGGDVVLVQSSSIPLDLAGAVDLAEPGSPAEEEDEE